MPLYTTYSCYFNCPGYFFLHTISFYAVKLEFLNDVLVTLEVRTILFWNGTEVTGCPISLAKFSPSSWTDFHTTLTHHEQIVVIGVN